MNKLLVFAMVLLLALPMALAASNCIYDGGCVRSYVVGGYPLFESTPNVMTDQIQRHTQVNFNISVGSCRQAYWDRGAVIYSYDPQPYNAVYDRWVNTVRVGGNAGVICGAGTPFIPFLGYTVTEPCVAEGYSGFEKLFVDVSHIAHSNVVKVEGVTSPSAGKDYFPVFREGPASDDAVWMLLYGNTTVLDDIKYSCENVSIKIIAFYNTPWQQETLWLGPTYSFQMVPPAGISSLSGNPVGNLVKYASYGFQSQAYGNLFEWNRSGTYQMAVFVKGTVNTTPERVALINVTITGPQGETDIYVNGTLVSNGSEYGGATYGGTSTITWPVVYNPADRDAFSQTMTGLGINKSLFWFLLMVVVAVIILIFAGGALGTYIWLALAVIEMLILFLGVYIHAVSWLWVAIPVVVFLIWVANMIKDAFT